MTPISCELLAPSLDTFGRSSTLPAKAYTTGSVFRWEQEHFDPSYASDFWDVTNRQDWTACEAVQRGVSSRGYRRGPLSPREDAVYQFITMVANGYLADGVARPDSRAPTPSTSRGFRAPA